MDRRRLHRAALVWALSATLSPLARAQDAASSPAIPPMRAPDDPTLDQAAMGLRSVLEVCVQQALDKPEPPVDLLWPQRLRSVWSEGDWLSEASRREERTPWMRFEHFEAVAQQAWLRAWPQAHPHLMLLVHRLDRVDLLLVLRDLEEQPERNRWATVQFERRAGGRLHSRLLGEVVQVQLEWLKAHGDRYRHNPAAHEAQVEMEHFEACQRITRAIVDSIFFAVALEEQKWRLTPIDQVNVPTHMATTLKALGPPPDTLPFRVRARPLPVPLVLDPVAPRKKTGR